MSNKKNIFLIHILLIGFSFSCNKKSGKTFSINGKKGGNSDSVRSTEIGQPLDKDEKKTESNDLHTEVPIGTREVRRLTATEYVNTIQNIFDIDISSELSSFPLEGSVFGFQNSADAFSAGPSQIEWFSATANILSERVVQNLAGTLPESCLNGKDFSCAKTQFDQYKFLLLRGKSDPYSEAMLKNVEKSRLQSGNVSDVLKQKLEILMQMPNFLYIFPPKIEGNHSVHRDEYDLATRLSLLAWKSLPDETLLNSAGHGNFVENYSSHVDTTLNSPKARKGFRIFVREWLYLDRLETIESSPGYEHITESLLGSMEKETLDFFENIAFNPDKDFMDIFKDNAQVSDPELENIYLLDIDDNQITKEKTRSGYLSQASFLTLTSLLNSTDPVARGHYVSKVFFCVKIPNPQLGITPLEEKVEYTTKKERYEAHSKKEPCAGCHIHMDRVGFAFENFDKSGRFRNIDEYNTTVDASGVYKFFDENEVPFKDFKDFNKKVIESEKVRKCLVKRSMEHALGFEIEYESKPFNNVYNKYLQTNKSYIDLLKAIVNSEVFRKVAGS
ncbi:MAG: DUF1588 domain-containing protein [Oligoflexales bacterium]